MKEHSSGVTCESFVPIGTELIESMQHLPRLDAYLVVFRSAYQLVVAILHVTSHMELDSKNQLKMEHTNIPYHVCQPILPLTHIAARAKLFSKQLRVMSQFDDLVTSSYIPHKHVGLSRYSIKTTASCLQHT
ncbi:hypothetical protein ABBQ38_010747 [Trebouxia sp. C0009 RCD-2024]